MAKVKQDLGKNFIWKTAQRKNIYRRDDRQKCLPCNIIRQTGYMSEIGSLRQTKTNTENKTKTTPSSLVPVGRPETPAIPGP